MKRTSFAILIGLFCLFPALFSQVRSEFLLEKNWKFTREDSPEFINPTFNDSKWQSVTVPHDWAHRRFAFRGSRLVPDRV